MPLMKAMNVPFHTGYGSLMWSKEWLSERPKWRGMLAEVRRAQRAKQSYFDMEKGVPQPFCLSLICFTWKKTFKATCWYEKQEHCPTNRYFMIIFGVYLGSTNEAQHFDLSLEADLAAIPHMKGDIYSFHMRHGSLICNKRLKVKKVVISNYGMPGTRPIRETPPRKKRENKHQPGRASCNQ